MHADSRQAAGAGDHLALQAAAGADLEHRLVGLAEGEFQRRCRALSLEGVGQRLQPVGTFLWYAEDKWARAIGSGQVLVLVERNVLVRRVVVRAGLEVAGRRRSRSR